MQKVIGVIPARYGSTRLPGKPLLNIFGKPMIVHTYLNAKKSKLINELYVATDHKDIADVITNVGGNVLMTPSDLKSGSDRIAFAIKNINCDIVVNIQGDEPFINSEAIDLAITPLLEDKEVLVSTLITKINDFSLLDDPNVVKVVKDTNNYALYFSRSRIPFIRDNKEKLENYIFYKHLGLYVYRKNFLEKFVDLNNSYLENCEKLEQLRILENGYRIKCIETNYESISIDTMQDFDKIKNFKI